jgi:serine phosphatase RsbU (regulator of sigma subunit)
MAELATGGMGEKALARIRHRLSYKFSLAIVLLLIVVMSISGFLLIGIQESALIEVKEKSSDKLIDFVAAISASSIERFTYYVLHQNAEVLQASEGFDVEVLSVIVRDLPEDEGVLGKPLHLNGRDPSEITVPQRYWLRKSVPCVSHSGRVLGSVDMIFSLEFAHRTVANARLAFIFTMLLMVVAIGGALAWLLMHWVAHPLRILTASAEEIAKGNFDVKMSLESGDEIGFLAQAINSMSRNLKENFTEIAAQREKIQGYSQNLQLMVDQRTAELHTANDELTAINTRFRAELEMAKRVQQGMFPDEEALKQRPEVTIAAHYFPIESIGGSFYDVLRVGRNAYGFLMADMSGHGVLAALVNTLAKVAFRANAHYGIAPSETCTKVNEEMHQLVADLGHYLTAYYGLMDLETGVFQFACAGHYSALLWRARTESLEKLTVSGVFIGVRGEGKYETKSVQIEPGDRMLFIAGGIFEARNQKGEAFGEERLLEYVRTHSDLHPDDFVFGLANTLGAFCDGVLSDDDRAILYFEFRNYYKA